MLESVNKIRDAVERIPLGTPPGSMPQPSAVVPTFTTSIASFHTGLKARAAVARRRVLRCLLLVAAMLLMAPDVPAQPSAARDYEVKAGFLVKFTQYTTWPSNTFNSSNAPVVIGVLGGEALFKQLEQEAKGVVGSRAVEVRQLNTLEEGARCQVVFIGEAESRNEAEWFAALKGKSILTVGESERTIENGAVMRFVIKNKNVRFEANLSTAAENRLELHERMLAVASKVYKR
jgi:hypothetical protein